MLSFSNRKKTVISHIVIMGDSLSDRGTLNHRYLFGCIPMAWISGLSSKSPRGRFTNGFAWSDDLSVMFMNNFLIRHAEKATNKNFRVKALRDPTDVADAIITASNKAKPKPLSPALEYLNTPEVSDAVISNRYFKHRIDQSYTLNNDLFIKYRGKSYIRSYDEGGLMAHDYRGVPSYNIKRFFTRLVLATLKQKRDLMLAYDKKISLSDDQKTRTLVIEWSGANDLITVNAQPSFVEVDKAIKARAENVQKLMAAGYQHFVLFNIPDLSLTPLFQNDDSAKGKAARENAQKVIEYFNQQLNVLAAAINKANPKISLIVFDISTLFTDIYNDTLNQTHKYPGGFEKDKLKISFTSSKDMVINKNLSPATGYSFWDDMHPTADMHEILAEEFYANITRNFVFRKPLADTYQTLCQDFQRKYQSLAQTNCHSFFSRQPKLPAIDFTQPKEAVKLILQLGARDKKIFKMLKDLEWVKANGKVNTEKPALKALNPTKNGFKLTAV